MPTENLTPIEHAPIDDAGPISAPPKLIGICCGHGWWFEAKSQQERCPEPYCYAPVHIYVWRNEHQPEDPRDDDE